MPSTCQPLIQAQQNRLVCEQILLDCAKALQNNTQPITDNGLLCGLSGQLLFQFKLSVYQPQWVDESRFGNQLATVQQNLGHSLNNPNLNAGLCGQAWFLEYINQHQGPDYYPELCQDIDSILLDILSADDWLGEIEAITGLGGFSIYAAKRAKMSSQQALFAALLKHYENLAVDTKNNTLSWPQPVHSRYKINKQNNSPLEFNLGFAHGVPGIIAALLPMLTIPQLQQSASRLITRACDWLLDQQLNAPSIQSCFANDSGSKTTSRLGWCYGDLTIALTLARVGNALNQPNYLATAKSLSLHALNRDHNSGFIADCGLCHGSAGLVLIFQQLANLLAEPTLLDGANRWLSDVIEQHKNHGLNGLNRYCEQTKTKVADYGLLMGYSGIGLSVLSALTGDTDWVDCLLLN